MESGEWKEEEEERWDGLRVGRILKHYQEMQFEILARDLLQEELNIVLESFKSGRDNGIDLRYAPSKDNSLIVQCKHYSGKSGIGKS